tara:strand:- start:466 stop:825 length:360 start_codon:yes stop_codon:yes gene_type:complete
MANVDQLFKSQFGQAGSVFTDTVNAPITPPTGKVFVAIQFLADTQLDELDFDPNSGFEYAGTDIAAHNLAVGSETAVSGGGGRAIDNANTFTAGTVIYGRYKKVTIRAGGAGSLIAYIG